tara:strand:- start:319 stop:1086 length:768 start_codon:yes stop_codon:yes gene_type:complete
MKLLRLGQTLCEGSSFPPQPPSANALLFLKENTHMFSGFDSSCGVVSPPTSSDDSTIGHLDHITKWEDYNGGSVYAEQTTCVDSPQYSSGAAQFDTSFSMYFDLSSDVVLTGEFTIYIKASLDGTSNKAFVGGSTSNFWRISNNKEFRVRIGGVTNNLFTEATDTINTAKRAYVFCLQRDSSGYLSMFVDGGSGAQTYYDKAWGSTTNQDTDTMTISNIGATADDTQTFEGIMRDVLIYDTEHNATQRNIIYNYL